MVVIVLLHAHPHRVEKEALLWMPEEQEARLIVVLPYSVERKKKHRLLTMDILQTEHLYYFIVAELGSVDGGLDLFYV